MSQKLKISNAFLFKRAIQKYLFYPITTSLFFFGSLTLQVIN